MRTLIEYPTMENYQSLIGLPIAQISTLLNYCEIFLGVTFFTHVIIIFIIFITISLENYFTKGPGF